MLLVLGAVSFLTSHIFWWRGVVTILAIGLATGWLALLDGRSQSRRGADLEDLP